MRKRRGQRPAYWTERETGHIVMWVFSLIHFVLLHRDKNCTAIWEAFQVVLEKDPCSVVASDYDLFITLSRHSIPRDKVALSPGERGSLS